MSKIAMFLADGFEEIEGLAVVDLARRAGLTLDTISITDRKEIHGSHDIFIQADMLYTEADFDSYDMLVLPGGGIGTKNLKASSMVKETVQAFVDADKYVAAICAAPTVMGEMGLLKGKMATCYGGMEEGLVGAEVSYDNVVKDGKFITSRGMGTAIEFGLAIVAEFCGQDKANELSKGIMIK